MNDHVTKDEFNGAVDEIKYELQKHESLLDTLSTELQKQGVMAEQRDDKLDVIIEMLEGNLEKTNKNTEKINENTKDINLNKLHIQNLQEVVNKKTFSAS